MNVSPISYNQNTSFNGRIITKGKQWTPIMKESIESSPYLQNFKEGYDLVARLATRTVRKGNIYHSAGQTLYKVKISLVKEGSKLAALLDKMHLLPRRSLSQGYHSETGTINVMDQLHVNWLKKKFN